MNNSVLSKMIRINHQRSHAGKPQTIGKIKFSGQVGHDESLQQGFFKSRCEGLGKMSALTYDLTLDSKELLTIDMEFCLKIHLHTDCIDQRARWAVFDQICFMRKGKR